ncbi:translocation/assembly module TamB domain-containing protein [Pokkaliibacter sp. CJK22405]|uniref:translocation/assembly module TamB domain-containing protein n=1 Tax=Pokkaliibacter sp. CJK22405 TaxID=3384615 RepID=UPI00398534A0
MSQPSASPATPPTPPPASPRKGLRWWHWLLAVLFGLILMVAVGLSWLVSTASGTRWLLGQVQGVIPGKLSYESVEGSLSDRLEFSNLSYQNEQGLKVALQDIVLDWRPLGLISLTPRLRLNTLSANGLELTLPPPTETPASNEPFTLPDIQLPVALDIQDISLNNAQIHQASGSTIVINNARLSLSVDGDEWQLQQLAVDAPQGKASLTGQLTPQGNYPLAMNLDWTLTLPDRPTLTGQGKVSGNLTEQLTVDQHITGAGDLDLNATLNKVLSELTWQAKITAEKVALSAATPSLEGSELDGTIEGKGSLSEASAVIHLETSLPEVGKTQLDSRLASDFSSVTLDTLDLLLPDSAEQEDQQARIHLEGKVTELTGTPVLDLKGKWQQLAYPVSATPTVKSSKGTLAVTGPLDKFRLNTTASVAGQDIPPTDLTLDGIGNTEGFSQLDLVLNTLEGQLKASGQAGWAPQPLWKLAVTADKINPGAKWPDMKGQLNARLQTDGTIKAGSPTVAMTIEKLDGELHQQKIAGTGSLQLAGQSVDINQLNVSWGNAKLISSGKLGDAVNLDWALSATDLHALMPAARGALSLNGTVTGTRQAPIINAKGTAKDLGYGQNRLANLDTQVFVDLGWSKPADIQLNASGIQAGTQRIDSLKVQGSGRQHQHQLAVQAKGPNLSLDTQLNGDWQDSQVWKGQISKLSVFQELIGPWAMASATPLEASASSAKLTNLCLQQERGGDGRLCSTANWSQKSGTKANVELSALPLSQLTGFLPGTDSVEGTVNAKANFSQGATGFPTYQADVNLQGAAMTVAAAQNTRLSLNDVSVHAEGAKDNLTARLRLALKELDGQLDANVKVTGVSKKGQLSGNLNTNLQDLTLISVFAPQVQEIKGQLNGDINLAGTLAKPKVSGQLALQNASAAIPMAGLELKDMSLNLADDPANPEQMLLTGAVTSGKGKLNLSGDLEPLAGKVNLQIKGDNFQAMGTEEIQAYISPDMQVKVAPQSIDVTGEITVPKAMISPPTYTSAITSSSDAVIVKGEGDDVSQLPGQQALNVALRLNLGKDVRVNAFGFNGRLEGSLMVNQSANRAATASGNINVAAGQYRIYGQDLNIDRGSLVFTGGPVSNPGLDMRVTRDFEDDGVTVGARVSGTIKAPKLDLFSTPAMPNSAQLSYLILGRGPDAASSSEQEMMMKAALALGASGSNKILGGIGDTFNLDDIGIDTGDSLDAASVYIGKYLTPSLYIKYGVGLVDPANTFLVRYKLTNHVNFESQAGTTSSGADIFYTLER